MIYSHTCHKADFETPWYKHWARELLQDESRRQNYDLYANKFWQNAVMAQILSERGMLEKGKKGVGFGVGNERLPALFTKLGATITATDQDFNTQKSKHWAKYELATGAGGLNDLGICDPELFAKSIEYKSVDMTKIPKSLQGKYDFLWSNCALGHLGSIPSGLDFIESSLLCLRPGGWAVHTTEINILSDEETVSTGDTVIFRLRDIRDLQRRLTLSGYSVKPLRLTLGRQEDDRRISMQPHFGNDYSRIHYKGHLLTQAVLVIHKPKNYGDESALSKVALRARLAGIEMSYRKNLAALKRFSRTDPTLKQILGSSKAEAGRIKLKPIKSEYSVKIAQGKAVSAKIAFRNESSVALFGAPSELTAKPIGLATTAPPNRPSKFKGTGWMSDNRPAPVFLKFDGKAYERLEYVAPGEDFLFELPIHANRLKKGDYTEEFCVVQDGVAWIDDTNVELRIKVV